MKKRKRNHKDPFTTNVTINHPDVVRWPLKCRGVIDTGATRTSIDYGLAHTLNLEPAGQVTVKKCKWKAEKETCLGTNRSL